MDREIRISLSAPVDACSTSDLLNQLRLHFTPDGALWPALDLLPQQPSRTALLESVELVSVRQFADRIELNYQVSLSDFSACAGVNHQFRYERTLRGTWAGSECLFFVWQAPPQRDMTDEI